MTFDELRKADFKNPTVALFYGLNCAPCERLAPKLKEVCAKLGARLEEFNSRLEMPAIRELGLRSVPAVVVVHRDGSVKVAFVGENALIEKTLIEAGVRPSA